MALSFTRSTLNTKAIYVSICLDPILLSHEWFLLALKHLYDYEIDLPLPDTPDAQWRYEDQIATLNRLSSLYRYYLDPLVHWIQERNIPFSLLECTQTEGFILLEELTHEDTPIPNP